MTAPATPLLATLFLAAASAFGSGARMAEPARILDGVDQLVEARNESLDAIAGLVRLQLSEAGSTEYFRVVAGEFPASSPFRRIEVRKPFTPPEARGLILLEIRAEACVPPDAVEARYGPFDDLSAPLAGGPPNRPADRVYDRPWGKLSFGFSEVGSEECLVRAIIDWEQ